MSVDFIDTNVIIYLFKVSPTQKLLAAAIEGCNRVISAETIKWMEEESETIPEPLIQRMKCLTTSPTNTAIHT